MIDGLAILLVAAAALLCASAAWVATNYFGRSLVSPFVVIPLSSFLYLASNGFRTLFEGQALEPPDIKIFLVGCLGLTAFVAGGGIGQARAARVEPTPDPVIAIAGYLLVVAGLLGQVYLLQTEGPLFFLEGKGARNLAQASLGPEKFAKDLLIPGQILLSLYYTRKKNWAAKPFLIASALVFCVFFLYEVRSAIALQFITFLYFYNRNVTPLSWRQLVVGASALFLLGAIGKYFFYYGRLWIGGEDLVINVDRDLIALTLTQHEFFAWVEILRNLEGEFLFGETIYRSLLSTLQPGFLGGESYSPTQWYADRYEAAAAQLGYGRGFTFLGELYVNFGTAGMALLLFLFGIAIRRAEDDRRYDFVAAFASGAFPFLWTGNSALLFKTYGVIYLCLPLLMLAILWLARRGLAQLARVDARTRPRRAAE